MTLLEVSSDGYTYSPMGTVEDASDKTLAWLYSEYIGRYIRLAGQYYQINHVAETYSPIVGPRFGFDGDGFCTPVILIDEIEPGLYVAEHGLTRYTFIVRDAALE